MSTSSDIIYLFNTAQENYTPIVGPTTDDNTVRLREAILAILYSISLGDDAGFPAGLILTDTAYKRLLVKTVGFDCMISPYKSYDPSIEENATDRLRKNMEHEWTAWLSTQLFIQSCEMGYRSFILKVVEDTWVRRLRDPDSF